ncbi:MAG: glycosyltransferase family 39 protein [Planctomycetes bacterium]|nr:glycosyltransferase family 39 protein [Planctomycetota bacterium]
MTRERLIVAVLIVAGLATSLVGLVDHDLWTPDEPREAEIAREIGLVHGPFVETLNAQPFLEKPPLHAWLTRLSYAIAGEATATAARIPAVLLSLGMGAFAWLLARRLFGGRAGIAAFFLTCFCVGVFYIGHRGILDTALAFAVAGAGWALDLGLHPRSPRERTWGWIAFYAFCAVGFYAKGMIAIAFPALAFLGCIAGERRFREPFRVAHILGGLFLLLAIGGWLFALWREDPSGGFVREFVIHNHLQRFLPSAGYQGGHEDHAPWYYILPFLGNFVPGTVFIVHAAIFHRRRRTPWSRIGIPLSWFALGFVLLTLAGTKRDLYLLPLFAPAAVLISPWVAAAIRGEGIDRWAVAIFWLGSAALAAIACLGPVARIVYEMGWGNGIFLPLAAVGAVGSAAVAWLAMQALARRAWPRFFAATLLLLLAAHASGAGSWIGFLDRYKSMRPFGEAVARLVPRDARLILFRPDETTRAVVPFYTGRFADVVGDEGDLRRILAEPGPTFVVFLEKRRASEGWDPPGEGEIVSVDRLLPQLRDADPPGVATRLRILSSHLSGTRRWMFLAGVAEGPTSPPPSPTPGSDPPAGSGSL